MMAHAHEGQWLPLMEYSVKKGLSLSTLRRYIKSGKVTFRLENGRYLIYDAAPDAPIAGTSRGNSSETEALQAQVRSLEGELRKAREEIAELKTLIAFYEERPASSPSSRLEA